MEKTKVELVCGFLESGKTTLLQRMLENDLVEQYEKIVVVQCEEGEKELHKNRMGNTDIVQVDIPEQDRLNRGLLEKIAGELNPDLVLVEYNGTWQVSDFLKIPLPRGWRMDQITFCADASVFQSYLTGVGAMVEEPLGNADSVLFNRESGVPQETLKNEVKIRNPGAGVFFAEADSDDLFYRVLKKDSWNERRAKKWESAFAGLIFLLCIGLFFAEVPSYTTAYSFIQGINTSFLGILVQAIPFLLIGVFVSSVLQLFVSDDRLARLFTHHPVLSFPLAALLGVLFPVCDCAMAPIVSRMVRKGVPVPQAIIFLLAAPAVNPVSILSTLFAFPGQPEYLLFRVILGIAVALITGLILLLRKIDPDEILQGGYSGFACSGGVTGSPHFTGWLGKTEAVFRHAGQEFFNMGRFIVLGALISSILQAALPASAFQRSGTNVVLPLLIMMLASIVMSVCSTSNAFIGRSFLNSFPPVSVLGFIVMGPMLDLSNLLMLGASFRKKFVLKLAALVFLIGFVVFFLFSVFIRM